MTTIPATISRYTATPINSKKKRRVAGYARVSTDHEDQATSYEAQVAYYTDYIKSRDDYAIYRNDGDALGVPAHGPVGSCGSGV